MGKEEVKSLFEPLGEVLNVQVIKKVIPTGTTSTIIPRERPSTKQDRHLGIRVYGFVKFAQIHTPELAITKFVSTYLLPTLGTFLSILGIL